MEELSLLILGAGWTATFLIPLLESRRIPFAATTTSGRSVAGVPTIPFKFDPAAPEPETRAAIAALPRARHVLVTFPLLGKGPSRLLVETYQATHASNLSGASDNDTEDNPSKHFRFIQLGSTGIWQQKQQQQQQQESTSTPNPWLDRHSPYQTGSPRAVAEDELLALGGCVLDLAGLWGGARHPRGWVRRVATSKEAVRHKTSLHLVHGLDVARAIVALIAGPGPGHAEDGDADADADGNNRWEVAGRGQRWMVTDGFVYDWWALMAGWAAVEQEVEEGPGEGDGPVTEQARWVRELMLEEGVKALPRGMEALGRCYDSREFWETLGLVPLKARV
ncbi:hypothetical protein N656DRAFT_779321 [Canariomyces notabilis]|uniref:Uncharacterized protein n=1 Tax=Canariomyces notabilis TaxID=2074819 RepID=A0AAN6YSM8_9PEZI|nr:hypothetical protein N656DRAFT_779321 [Canariomyces arenarius]